MAVLQTEAAQQCSPVSFAALPSGASCPYSGEGVRTFKISTVTIDYYFKKFGKDALHGVYLIPKDLPSTIAATMPHLRGREAGGHQGGRRVRGQCRRHPVGLHAVVQAIKTNKSTYARNGLDYVSTVFIRKEAQVQGVNTVKVWDCSLQCYDKRLISEGGSAVEGQYVWLSFLPFEDKGHNDELDAFLQYDKKPDGFGAQAWVAGEIFAEAVNDDRREERTRTASPGPGMLDADREHPRLRRRRVRRADRHRRPDGQHVPDRHAGAGRQVRARRSGRAGQVRLQRHSVITITIDPVKAYKG